MLPATPSAVLRAWTWSGRTDHVPAPRLCQPEQPPLGMHHDRMSHMFQQGPIAPVIGITHSIRHQDALLVGPSLSPVKLALAVTGGPRAHANQSIAFDHNGGGQSRGAPKVEAERL